MSGVKKKLKKWQKILLIVAAVIAVLALSFFIYVGTYYRAGDLAKEAMKGTEYVRVEEVASGVTAFIPEEPVAAIIFYPGGKVEYTAYAPLLKACAEQDILCLLVKMPFNLAVFDMNAADGLKELYPEIQDWYMCGHSLGGAMAANYVAKHTGDYKGLVLLASYSTESLANSGLDVLCCYGTEDGVMNRTNYEKYKVNLPLKYDTFEIFGGCHAGFGDYGAQSGDGTPTVSTIEQIELTAEYIGNFIYEGIQMK